MKDDMFVFLDALICSFVVGTIVILLLLLLLFLDALICSFVVGIIVILFLLFCTGVVNVFFVQALMCYWLLHYLHCKNFGQMKEYL